MNWKKTWLLSHRFCLSNKIREVHVKIVHNIYPCNSIISKFANIDQNCTFCSLEKESILHLFYHCQYAAQLWKDISNTLSIKYDIQFNFTTTDIITYATVKDSAKRHIVNLFILLAKYHIHKSKFSKHPPKINLFLIELNMYIEALKNIDNKKCTKTLKYLFPDP